MRFTAEELVLAKQVDLCRVAEHLGYTVKRIGQYHTLKEMDSIRIYDRSHWCRFSRRHDKGENGGSQIDFLRVFAGLDVKEAVFWLLDFAGYHRGGETSGRFRMPFHAGRKRRRKSRLFCRSHRAATHICTIIWNMSAGLPARLLTSL